MNGKGHRMMVDDDSQRRAPPIRVLVANLSRVLAEIIVQAIQQQADMALLHYAPDLADLPVGVEDQTDVLLLGAAHVYPPPEICRDLWETYPSLKVLVLTPSGDAAVVYWLSVERHRLKTVSAETLIRSIRHAHRLDLTAE
jgi:DNA-binding NarL/FixJ family response regulator